MSGGVRRSWLFGSAALACAATFHAPQVTAEDKAKLPVPSVSAEKEARRLVRKSMTPTTATPKRPPRNSPWPAS